MTGVRSDPQALKSARERAGHTMRSLAEKSGVSVQRISELEKLDDNGQPLGVLPPTAKRLADALGVDIDAITQPDEPAGVAS